MKQIFSAAIAVYLIMTGLLLARPDGHAPIGVMGDHMHGKGEWMLSYRFMDMRMDGMRQGEKSLSSQDVFALGYPVAPTEMTMQMHMLGLMVAPNDQVMWMLMTHYVVKEMDHVSKPGSMPRMKLGESFTKKSEGWGDSSVAALVRVLETEKHHAHLNLGLGIPTGSIDEKDPEQLAYPMQTGSGTWDLKPGITYSSLSDNFSWGAQALATIRLGRNDADYSFGDVFEATGWSAWKLCDWASVSGRLKAEHIGRIDGDDDRVTARMAPPQDPANTGGDFVEAGLGLNLVAAEGVLLGHRLALEWMLPLHQDVNGVQLKREQMITVGWQKAW